MYKNTTELDSSMSMTEQDMSMFIDSSCVDLYKPSYTQLPMCVDDSYIEHDNTSHQSLTTTETQYSDLSKCDFTTSSCTNVNSIAKTSDNRVESLHLVLSKLYDTGRQWSNQIQTLSDLIVETRGQISMTNVIASYDTGSEYDIHNTLRIIIEGIKVYADALIQEVLIDYSAYKGNFLIRRLQMKHIYMEAVSVNNIDAAALPRTWGMVKDVISVMNVSLMFIKTEETIDNFGAFKLVTIANILFTPYMMSDYYATVLDMHDTITCSICSNVIDVENQKTVMLMGGCEHLCCESCHTFGSKDSMSTSHIMCLLCRKRQLIVYDRRICTQYFYNRFIKNNIRVQLA